MAKAIPDAIIDLMLAIPEGTDIHVCSAEPTTFAEATTTFNLASANTGSYSKSAGSPSGRQNTHEAIAAVPITTSGTATHVAITTATGSILNLVTTTTSQVLTSGNSSTVDLSSFSHTITSPV